MKKIVFSLLAVLVLGAVAGFYYLDRQSNGIVGFYVWKTMSGVEAVSGRAAVNDISLYYETFGQQNDAVPPVLIMHGGTAFLETMHHQISALAASRFVIAPDSRAHGRSSDSDGVDLTYALMADDMVGLLDQLGIKKVDIVGWSDGGNIGLDMALRHPARVNRLVMYGSNFHFSGTGGDLASDIDADSDDWAPVRSFYKDVAADPDHWPVFLGKVVAMWRAYPRFAVDELGAAEAPTLVMAGEFDSIEDAHTREMASAIPGAKLIIVEGEDHYAPLMAPEKVTPAIIAFLR